MLGSVLLGMVEVQPVRGHCQPLPQMARVHWGQGFVQCPAKMGAVQCRGRGPVLESALAVPATWQGSKSIPALCRPAGQGHTIQHAASLSAAAVLASSSIPPSQTGLPRAAGETASPSACVGL